PIRRHNYVSRGNEIVERRHRAYRSHVIAADRELVTKKESFVNRHAFYERERICVSNLRRRGETADSSDQDAEPEHFGKLGSLPSNRIKLGEFKRWFIRAHVAEQTCDSQRRRQRSSLGWVDTSVT